jgi:1-phosphofructokinase/tagatose 6-phosphate kinase
MQAGQATTSCTSSDTVIVTVTLNAAIDRTLTVPNFQRGQRHRASAGLTLAGGKGINVARALKAFGVPVVATGLVGGTTGNRIVEELGHEAILNDFVHIEGESRTSTAVVDPTGSTYTEINEWGPAVRPEELELLLEKLRYLTQGAELVVFAGSLPRDVEDDFYAEAARDLARRHIPAVLDTEGEPLRLAIEAEPFLVSPNQAEAEALVGQEFHDDEDFRLALEGVAEMGARNVLITTDEGCVALLREERETRSFRAVAPRVEPVSTVGSGDVLLAAFLAAQHNGRSQEDSLRAAVAAGAASTLEIGAGRFDSRQAGRLQAGVEVSGLEPAEVSP